MPAGRKKRDLHYPFRLVVCLSQAQVDALEVLAEAEGVGQATIARRAPGASSFGTQPTSSWLTIQRQSWLGPNETSLLPSNRAEWEPRKRRTGASARGGPFFSIRSNKK